MGERHPDTQAYIKTMSVVYEERDKWDRALKTEKLLTSTSEAVCIIFLIS